MSEVDWSKAPEGATHYLRGKFHPWHRLINDEGNFAYWNGVSWMFAGALESRDEAELISRPQPDRKSSQCPLDSKCQRAAFVAEADQLRQRVEHQQHEIEMLRQWGNSVTTQASTDKMLLEVERDRLRQRVAGQDKRIAELEGDVRSYELRTTLCSKIGVCRLPGPIGGEVVAATPQPAPAAQLADAASEFCETCKGSGEVGGYVGGNGESGGGYETHDCPHCKGTGEAPPKSTGMPRTEPLDDGSVRYTFDKGVVEASYVAGVASVVVRK